MRTPTIHDKRQAKRATAAQRRRELTAADAVRREERDEAIAPAVQRKDVCAPDGEVIRAARVVRDGAVFVRANPLAHIAAAIQRAADGGDPCPFTASHIAAARRLTVTWDAVGEGVGLGASDWGKLRSKSGRALLTPIGHSALVAQVAQRQELEAVHTFVGALWPCLEAVVLRGMSPAIWGASVHIGRNAAPGFLLAALERLVEFYAARAEPERPVKIRTMEFVGGG